MGRAAPGETVSGNHTDFARRLAALAERLARISTELAAAGRGLIERRLLPPEGLVDELAGIRTDFEDLRTRVLDAAAALSLGPTPPVTTVRELEVLLRVVTDTESRRARRRQESEVPPAQRSAFEEARPPAAEDAKRQAELEARRRAEEEAALRQAEEAKRHAAEEARKRAAEADERAQRMEQERRAAEEAARRQAEEEAQRRTVEEARRRAEDENKRRAEEEAKRQEEEERRRREQEARRRAEEARRPAAAEEAPARAAEVEEADLGLETAQWWISANASWTSMKSRQVSFADSVPDVLVKYPYVFSVPIQTSADYEDGLLAYGYAVLLDYMEQRSAGFVSEALNRLPARKGTSLGRRLYDYVAELLRPGFGDFIRAVMLAALPRTAPWVNGGIEDSEQATTVFVRPSGRLGDTTQKAERFTQEQRRFADHEFTAAVAPLTARFFRVEATEVKDPRTVEVRLSENGSPSDHAWVVTASTRAAPAQARRHERQGTTVAGLGRDYSAVWIGLFNADTETEQRFDLTIGLKRRAATAAFRKK